MEEIDTSSLIPSFRKPIEALVLMPTVGSLSPQARKMFNVVLHVTQLQAAEVIASGRVFNSEEFFAGHVFESPLKELLRPIEAEDSDSYQITSAKKCFREMRRTESDWTAPDAGSKVLFSSMSLLSQAEITKRKGIVYASWAFPPKLMRILINPKMYAPLDNEQIAKLKTYAAVALYEICVRYRYKDKPTALTAVHELEWWVDALTASPKKDQKTGKVKLRPWAKFKYDQGNKAIKEINEKTNILIELIEHKGQGKTLVAAQFKVTHKDMVNDRIAAKPEIRMSADLAELTLSAGVDPKIVLGLLKNGQREVGLKAALVKFKNRKLGLQPIVSVSAYLCKMLEEINEMINHVPEAVNHSRQTVLPAAKQGNQMPLPMVMSFKDERRTAIREVLLSLEVENQKVYAYLALADLRKSKMARASTSEKVEANTWTQDPLLISKMVDIYANEKYGPDWGVENSQS